MQSDTITISNFVQNWPMIWFRIVHAKILNATAVKSMVDHRKQKASR